METVEDVLKILDRIRDGIYQLSLKGDNASEVAIELLREYDHHLRNLRVEH